MITIISPHIDDALLSLGGLVNNLASRNQGVRIVYVFTISDWTNAESIAGTRYEKNTELVTRLRKEEEQRVAAKLGYEFAFLDFPDTPLRADEDPEEAQALIEAIDKRLQTVLSPDEPCFFPIGHLHPDHAIVHDLGLRFVRKRYNILFYEDQPYTSCNRYDYQEAYKTFRSHDMTPVLEPYDLVKKVEALHYYASQVSEQWLRDIANFSYNLVDNTFYERYWKPATSKLNFIPHV